MKQKVHTYDGADATVTWDQRRCIHYEACVHGQPQVFDPDRRPWIEPDRDGPDALLSVVTACPTGALHLRLPDGTDPEPTPARNVARVAPDGPLYVRGDLTVQDEAGAVLLRDTRVALCRCGLSRNKPLCDNSHRGAFQDPGSLAGSPPARTAPTGGPLTITLAANGPLRISGALTVIGAGGARDVKETAALCRCGASANKPYCDGSHRRVGFEAP